MGRNDEDVTSAFIKILNQAELQKRPEVVLWLDNCSAQNKNWTFYSTLVAFFFQLDENSALTSITLKYFEAGHAFMSADSFHALAEKAFKKSKNIYDFRDYECALRTVGITVPMRPGDFLTQFRRGSTMMYFKTSHGDAAFREADFLMKKCK